MTSLTPTNGKREEEQVTGIDINLLVTVCQVQQHKHSPVPESERFQLSSVRRVKASNLVGSQVLVLQSIQGLRQVPTENMSRHHYVHYSFRRVLKINTCTLYIMYTLDFSYRLWFRVPVSVRHVAIGESNQELAKRNLYIFANLAKSNKWQQ